MTPVNMAKHRNNPNMPFWKMIKEGYDHFEVTRQEPKVEFCENKYVFDPAQPPNSSKPLTFNAAAKCPAYVIPDEIADAVRDKQQQEAAETAKLVAKGTPAARLNTGIDGGMNKVFAAKLPGADTGLSEGGEGQSLSLLALSRAPGTIPSHVNPPRNPLLASQEEPVVAVTPAAAPATRVASVAPEAKSEGFFSNLARKVGLSGADTTSTAVPAKPKVIEAKDTPRPSAAVPKPTAPKPADTRVASAVRPPFKPTVSDPTAAPPAKDAMVAGAQPIVPASSFESRFSAVK
jgi:hypothetical protein